MNRVLVEQDVETEEGFGKVGVGEAEADVEGLGQLAAAAVEHERVKMLTGQPVGG